MEINLDFISALFKSIGVHVSPKFNPQFDNVQGDGAKTRVGTNFAGTTYYANDLTNGREYFLPVRISYVNSANQTVSYNLPFPVISITSKKTIIKTPLTERRGTVKEFIQLEDYIIKIRGFAIAGTNDFPEDIITDLRNIWEAGGTVNVANALTDIFLLRPDRSGDDTCVIEQFDLPEIVGVKNVKHYVMELVSDEPFDLNLIT